MREGDKKWKKDMRCTSVLGAAFAGEEAEEEAGEEDLGSTANGFFSAALCVSAFFSSFFTGGVSFFTGGVSFFTGGVSFFKVGVSFLIGVSFLAETSLFFESAEASDFFESGFVAFGEEVAAALGVTGLV